jgi:PEP-CTERM motif
MRKSLWIMLAILLVAIGAPSVRADSVYAITFYDGFGAGHPTVVGSNLLDYNSTSMEFTTISLQVSYDGLTITLENDSAGGVPISSHFIWFADTPNRLISFSYICPCDPFDYLHIYSATIPETIQYGKGDVSLTAQTPEPSSVALMLLGLGLVLLLRKLNTRGHQLAT